MQSGFFCVGTLLGTKARSYIKDGKTSYFYSVGVKTQKPDDFGTMDTTTVIFEIPGFDVDDQVRYYDSLKGKNVSVSFSFGIRLDKQGNKFLYQHIHSAVECRPEK
ncbi:hypothetical protein ABN789_001204 [Salmonella enterica]